MHLATHSLSLVTLLHVSLASILRIDDRDPSVKYSPAWTNGLAIPDDPSLNWDGTLHYCNITGETATLKFTGTSIAVYGSLHPPGRYSMQSRYSVDGQEPFLFLPNQEVPDSVHQTLFYSSPGLPYGEHTLVVTNLGEQIFLDFFDVQDQNESPPISSTLVLSTTRPNAPTHVPTALSSEGGQTETVTSTTNEQLNTTRIPQSMPTRSVHLSSVATILSTSATPTPKTLPPRQHPPFTPGVMTGVAIGGAGVVILAALGVVFFLRRRGNEGDREESNDLASSLPTGEVCVEGPATPFPVNTGQISVTNSASSSETPSVDCTQAPFHIGSLASTFKNQKDDNILQSLNPRPSAEPLCVLDGSIPRIDNVQISLPKPGIATTTSDAPQGDLDCLPFDSSPGPTYADGGERMGPSSTDGQACTVVRVGLPRIHEDGGVCLAGGPLGETRVEEEDAEEIDDLPPPYQQF